MVYRSSKQKQIDSIKPLCKKTIYNTREDAEDMIAHIRETRVAPEIKAYKCNICGFWHLTSKGK